MSEPEGQPPGPVTGQQPAARGMVDLHAHTTASDGLATPARFVEVAAAAGLSAIAVTDHDTVAAVPEVTALAARHGLTVVAGVELSVHDEAGREVHLLGLHLSDLALIDGALVAVREARRVRAVRIVERLGGVGVTLSVDAVLAESGGGAVGRPHVARALMKAGQVSTLQEAFDRWLGAGRPAYVEKQRLSIADGIALVHRAGGLAVYAHPGPEGTQERVEPLAGLGLDGLEVRHPSHSAEDVKRLRMLVRTLGLVPSGGSDWHGAASGQRTLGCMQVSPEWFDLQVERVTKARAAR